MNSKTYKLPNGNKAVFEYDTCGIGKITLECMDELMEMIEDRPQGWIPCSERLPSGADTVLVSTCVFDAIYDVVFMMAKDVERFYECGYVNAWMPSPEPWKGADDED